MKNKLIDLNNHLFATLERLNDEAITAEKLQTEIERSRAVSGIAKDIVMIGRLALDAEVAKQENQLKALPRMISDERA